MAVMSKEIFTKPLFEETWPVQPPAMPTGPTDLQVTLRDDESLEIHWQADAEFHVFELKRSYYLPGMLDLQDPFFSDCQEVGCRATLAAHPDRLPKGKAWTVTLSLKAKSENGCTSDPVRGQVAWDDQLSKEATREDLRKGVRKLKEKQLAEFKHTRGSPEGPEILIVGQQHHGKSSLGNHFYRCLHYDLNCDDQLSSAPGGVDEKTMAVKRLSTSEVTFIDTPAISVIDKQTKAGLKALMTQHIPDGTRRADLSSAGTAGNPPDAAILVISLCHFRDQPEETQIYLEKMAQVFKDASEFPYAVAATHRDEFLKECQGDPWKALDQAVEKIRKFALAKHVYPITNYEKGSPGSFKNNGETFNLLGQLLSTAKSYKQPAAPCDARSFTAEHPASSSAFSSRAFMNFVRRHGPTFCWECLSQAAQARLGH